jgi:predicted RNase H-like HicB family nuclease
MTLDGVFALHCHTDKNGDLVMQVKLRRNADGILEAHVDDPQRDRDRLFDMVMSLSDFAHEKGLTDVSLHLEEVLDTILKRAKQQPQARPKRDPSQMSKAERLMLVASLSHAQA